MVGGPQICCPFTPQFWSILGFGEEEPLVIVDLLIQNVLSVFWTNMIHLLIREIPEIVSDTFQCCCLHLGLEALCPGNLTLGLPLESPVSQALCLRLSRRWWPHLMCSRFGSSTFHHGVKHWNKNTN